MTYVAVPGKDERSSVEWSSLVSEWFEDPAGACRFLPWLDSLIFTASESTWTRRFKNESFSSHSVVASYDMNEL